MGNFRGDFMKKVFVGGFLSMIGTIWGLAIIIFAGNHLVNGWSTPPGRFLTTIVEMGLTPFFVISVILAFCGIVILIIEYFKKDN